MKNRVLISVLLIFSCCIGSVNAHEQKAALTKVVFNDRTQNIEVMHRLSLHDAEHAATALWNNADLNNAETRQNLANYVRSRFSIKDEQNENLALVAVGEEIDGIYLWVYHEAPMATALGKLTIENRIFFEFWDDQSNLVNIENGDKISSFTFDQRATRQLFNLAK